jgi:hypothetical protein
MAWSQRGQVSAKEILGMEPDELKSKLESSATKEDLTKLNTEFESQKGTLSEIQAMLKKLTAPEPPAPDPNVKLDADDPTTQILTDPAGFINRQTAGTQQVAAQARADVLEMRARQKYAGIFQKYGDDVMEKAQQFSLAQRAQDGFWDFHIRTFTGEKFLRGEVEPGSYPSLVGSSSFAPNSSGDVDDPNKGFSPDMAAFFKERNVPLDRAAKIQKLMEGGEQIDLKNYKGVVGNA